MRWQADDPLGPFLERQGVVVLDGGLATELEARGESLADPLWSAAVLLERPERIRDVHEAYLSAGADCVITASYQASFDGLARRGLSPEECEEVLLRSVALAEEARRRFWEGARPVGRLRPLVAASIGPYGAYLADGSEYRGDYGVGRDALVDFHGRRLGVLAASGSDLLAIETIPSSIEALALVEILERTPGPPAWMSFSCRDERRLCDGTPIERVVEAVGDCDRLLAVGVNCTAPRFVAGLLRRAAQVSRLPLVAYPNSGEGYDAASRSWLPGSESALLVDRCDSWRALGARLIGGCCRTRPEDIARLRARLVDGPDQGEEALSVERDR